MAYLTADLNLVAPNVGANRGGSVWSYINVDDDTPAAIRGANFIADGSDKGLRVDDQIISKTDAGVGIVYIVSAVVAGAAATVT